MLYVDKSELPLIAFYFTLMFLAFGFIVYTELYKVDKKPLQKARVAIYKATHDTYVIKAVTPFKTTMTEQVFARSKKQAKWIFFVRYGSKPVIQTIYKKHKKPIDPS